MAGTAAGQGFEAVLAMVDSATPDAFYTRADAFDAAVTRLEDILTRFRSVSRQLQGQWAGSTATTYDGDSQQVATGISQVTASMTSPAWSAQLRQAGDALATAQQRMRDLAAQRAAALAAPNPAPGVEAMFDQLAAAVLTSLSGSYQQAGTGMTPLHGEDDASTSAAADAPPEQATDSTASTTPSGGATPQTLAATSSAQRVATDETVPDGPAASPTATPFGVPDTAAAGTLGLGGVAPGSSGAATGTAGDQPTGSSVVRAASTTLATGLVGAPAALGREPRARSAVTEPAATTLSAVSGGPRASAAAATAASTAAPASSSGSGSAGTSPAAALPMAIGGVGGPLAQERERRGQPDRARAAGLSAVDATAHGPSSATAVDRGAPDARSAAAGTGQPMMPMTGLGTGAPPERETERRYAVAFEDETDAWGGRDGAPAALGRPERR